MYIAKHILLVVISGMGIGVGLYNLYESYKQKDFLPGICLFIIGGGVIGVSTALIVSICIKMMSL